MTDNYSTELHKAQTTTAEQSPIVDDEYAVGYGKPPKHSQFKKGQSGNPKGRPKKSRNLRTLIQEELETMVILQENGKQIKTTKAAAMSKRIVNKALSGDPRAIQTLIRMIPQEQQDDIVELNDDDFAAFTGLRQRIATDHAMNLRHQTVMETEAVGVIDNGENTGDDLNTEELSS